MKKPFVLATVLVGIVAISLAGSQKPRAHESQEQSSREKATPLLAAPVAGTEGKEVRIVHVSAPPGFVTPKHYHPGQLFIYVLEGAVTIDIEGQAPVKLGPGDIMQEPSGKSMTGRNTSSTHGAELILFEIGDKEEPLTVKAE